MSYTIVELDVGISVNIVHDIAVSEAAVRPVIIDCIGRYQYR